MGQVARKLAQNVPRNGLSQLTGQTMPNSSKVTFKGANQLVTSAKKWILTGQNNHLITSFSYSTNTFRELLVGP